MLLPAPFPRRALSLEQHGRRLFVAPVESDLNSKPKRPTAAERSVQGRSAIRRSRRGDDRESRALRRRAAILNDVSPGHTDPLLARLQNARPGTTEIWVTNSRGGNTAIAYPGVEVDTRERPVRNFREAVGWRESQREAAQAPPERGSNANRGTEEQTEQPNSYETEQPYSYDAAHPYTYRRSDIAPSLAARFDRSPDSVSSSTNLPQIGPDERTVHANRLAMARMIAARRQHQNLDGLGDRNRSVSPEVWDTLLTTLTPDPQPPSAGSSFASATASTAATSQRQSAAASSRTSLAEHDAIDGPLDGPLVDQPCETGEGTDSEGSGLPAVTVPSRYRRFISSLHPHNVENISHVRAEPADRPTLTFNGRPDGVWTSIDRLRARMQDARNQEAVANARARMQQRREARAEAAADRRGAAAPSRAASSPWLESGTDQQTTSGTGTTREGSEEVSESLDQGDLEPASGDNDAGLGDMQHIVRGLVERRDIPDEWWAEAGLSRLIPDEP